jgi:hypothetical protein
VIERVIGTSKLLGVDSGDTRPTFEITDARKTELSPSIIDRLAQNTPQAAYPLQDDDKSCPEGGLRSFLPMATFERDFDAA